MDQEGRKRIAYREANLSTGLNIVLFVIKISLGIMISSVALRADAFHTLSDISTSQDPSTETMNTTPKPRSVSSSDDKRGDTLNDDWNAAYGLDEQEVSDDADDNAEVGK